MSELLDILRKRIPRCLRGVVATVRNPIDTSDDVVTSFTLTQKETGEAQAQMLGYPLGEYNPKCKNDPDYIGPLTLRWSDGSDTCVFDSDIHGYHGEIDSSAKLRGVGTPKPFCCGKCGQDRFSVTVEFDYWDDLLDDAPDGPVEDYFGNIMFEGTCANCGTTQEVLNMDL